MKSCANTKTVPPVDGAVAGDDAVAEDLLLVHAEVGAAVGDELVELDEAARVEQQVDALARGQLAGLVLALDALGAAAGRRLPLQRLQAAKRRCRRALIVTFAASSRQPQAPVHVAADRLARVGGRVDEAQLVVLRVPFRDDRGSASAPPSGRSKRTSTGAPARTSAARQPDAVLAHRRRQPEDPPRGRANLDGNGDRGAQAHGKITTSPTSCRTPATSDKRSS